MFHAHPLLKGMPASRRNSCISELWVNASMPGLPCAHRMQTNCSGGNTTRRAQAHVAICTLREQLRFWFWIEGCISDVFLYLFSDLVFGCLKFLSVCLMPFVPDGNEECLDHACNWRGK
jgi:hypothetical protein